MVRSEKREVETFSIWVEVTQNDIDNTKPCDPYKCMHKVAVARALNAQLEEDVTDYLRVDAGHIHVHYDGFRWAAPSPKKVKDSLIKFDNPKTRKLVKPHSYSLHFVKGTKIYKRPAWRQEQINEARRQRIAAGFKDKLPNRMTLRKRIVGYV